MTPNTNCPDCNDGCLAECPTCKKCELDCEEWEKHHERCPAEPPTSGYLCDGQYGHSGDHFNNTQTWANE